MSYLCSRLAANDFTRTLNGARRRRLTLEWRNAFDEALAYCESGGIDPRHYFTSVADSMGYFCEKQKIPLIPAHVAGKGAIERYNRWLSRQQAQSNSADALFMPKRDVQMHAELAYVEVFGAMIGAGDTRRAHKIAMEAANEVQAEYTRCPLRRVIALSDYLHRLHHALPDVLVLRKGWTTRAVLCMSFVLVRP